MKTPKTIPLDETNRGMSLLYTETGHQRYRRHTIYGRPHLVGTPGPSFNDDSNHSWSGRETTKV